MITIAPSATTTYRVTVTDANGCSNLDEVIITVEDCPCNIQVILSPSIYNDNNTPNDVTDDTFTFQATVNGAGSSGWTGGGLEGNYGTTVTYGPYPVDQSGIGFKISDKNNDRCFTNVSANMKSCTYLKTCTCCAISPK